MKKTASTNETWQAAVAAYLATLTPSTADQYRVALDDFAEWYSHTYGETPDPERLTDEEAREWRGYLSGVKNYAASTVNVRLSAIRGLARYHGEPVEVQGVRKVQAPVDPLTGRELGRLAAVVRGHRWGPQWLALRNSAMVALMARAGLRVSEVVALDLGDVEINARSGRATIRQGKGLKEREVPLALQVRKRLREYLDERPAWVGESDKQPALFVSKTGNRLNERDVQRMVTSAAARAGIDAEKTVTAHVLRHTFATRFLRKGGDLATLRDILGHTNLATTSRYLHADAARMQEMVEAL